MSLLTRRRAMMGKKAGEVFPDQEIGVELIQTVLTGYTVDPSTGALTANSVGRYCDYIPVAPGRSYNLKKYNNRPGYYALYDKDKTYLDGSSVGNSTTTKTLTFSTTSLTRFVRWSGTSGSSGPLSMKRIA